jgi:hypothetical protein
MQAKSYLEELKTLLKFQKMQDDLHGMEDEKEKQTIQLIKSN